MKKILWVALLFSCIGYFLSCTMEKTQKQVIVYSVYSEEDNDKMVFVEPDDYYSFEAMLQRIDSISCSDSLPAIRIIDGHIERRIALLNPCPNHGSYSLKVRDRLQITDNKIEVSKTDNLDSLEVYLSLHYYNYGQSHLFSDDPRKARITISYKDKPMTGLKPLLLRIVRWYEQQEKEVPQAITMHRIIPPPPPPPYDKY